MSDVAMTDRVLQLGWDPLTLRPVYGDRRAVGDRLTDLATLLGTERASDKRRRPNEFSLQFEALELYLWLGRIDRARALAGVMLGRARQFRLTNQIALAEAITADLRVWEGDHVAATLDLIEVAHRAGHEPDAVQAAILFRMGRCEYVQGMYVEALANFTVAAGLASGRRLLAVSKAEIRNAAVEATARLARSVA